MTPAEHLSLPDENDAYLRYGRESGRHVGDIAKDVPGAIERDVKNLHCPGMPGLGRNDGGGF